MNDDDSWRLDDDGWECPCALRASQDTPSSRQAAPAHYHPAGGGTVMPRRTFIRHPSGNGIKAQPITRLPRPSTKEVLLPQDAAPAELGEDVCQLCHYAWHSGWLLSCHIGDRRFVLCEACAAWLVKGAGMCRMPIAQYARQYYGLGGPALANAFLPRPGAPGA